MYTKTSRVVLPIVLSRQLPLSCILDSHFFFVAHARFSCRNLKVRRPNHQCPKTMIWQRKCLQPLRARYLMILSTPYHCQVNQPLKLNNHAVSQVGNVNKSSEFFSFFSLNVVIHHDISKKLCAKFLYYFRLYKKILYKSILVMLVCSGGFLSKILQ